MRIKALEPEIIHMEGDALVPAKAVSYKTNESGHIVETIKPRTHEFENSLNKKMKKELEGVTLFPTKEYVFLSITYGLNSKNEYKTLDLDNRAKTILDALKGVVYEDDRQVRVLLTDKVFLENSSESYYRFSVKILDNKTEESLRKHLMRIGS